jgi:K+-transporting ATPase KdpF subunit
MAFELWAGALVCFGLLIYLLLALIKPDKF